MPARLDWPKKRRELHNHHFDSTIWNDFRFRDDDIVIATYAKSGTTWMQQIVGQLMLGPDPELPVADLSPRLDLRVPPKHVKLPVVEAQTHRRFIKTHLPLDALVFSPQAKFTNKGVNGRWAETFAPEDVTEYESRAVQELGPECARWIATGEGLD
jgi:aryl sulfotransferase